MRVIALEISVEGSSQKKMFSSVIFATFRRGTKFVFFTYLMERFVVELSAAKIIHYTIHIEYIYTNKWKQWRKVSAGNIESVVKVATAAISRREGKHNKSQYFPLLQPPFSLSLSLSLYPNI